jgi:hypothetical protein
MDRISRRAALGSVAASAMVGLGATAEAEDPKPHSIPRNPERPVKSMTLEEFRRTDTPISEADLFNHIHGKKTFSMCHREIRKKHGIWIPELVPVFEKLDAMRASTT